MLRKAKLTVKVSSIDVRLSVTTEQACTQFFSISFVAFVTIGIVLFIDPDT